MPGKRKKHADHISQERWLVSYADFITLLFAFFVVMFAVSQVDNAKLGRFAESVRAVTLWNGPQLTSSTSGAKGSPTAPVTLIPTNVLVSHRPPGAELRLMRDLLRQRLRNAILGQRISIEQEDRSLIVRLQDAGFFDSGSADLRSDALGDLRVLGDALRDMPYPIRIEGHTDSLPIRNTSRYRSNWELSAARAASVLACLQAQAGIAEKRFSIAGYADKHPVAPNGTEAGRRKNRRVDVVVMDPEAASDANLRSLWSGAEPPPGSAPERAPWGPTERPRAESDFDPGPAGPTEVTAQTAAAPR